MTLDNDLGTHQPYHRTKPATKSPRARRGTAKSLRMMDTRLEVEAHETRSRSPMTTDNNLDDDAKPATKRSRSPMTPSSYSDIFAKPATKGPKARADSTTATLSRGPTTSRQPLLAQRPRGRQASGEAVDESPKARAAAGLRKAPRGRERRAQAGESPKARDTGMAPAERPTRLVAEQPKLQPPSHHQTWCGHLDLCFHPRSP